MVSTWAHGSQRPLTEEVLGVWRSRSEPPGVGLHVGLLVVRARSSGAVVQETVRSHHLRVTALTPAHPTLSPSGEGEGERGRGRDLRLTLTLGGSDS